MLWRLIDRLVAALCLVEVLEMEQSDRSPNALKTPPRPRPATLIVTLCLPLALAGVIVVLGKGYEHLWTSTHPWSIALAPPIWAGSLLVSLCLAAWSVQGGLGRARALLGVWKKVLTGRYAFRIAPYLRYGLGAFVEELLWRGTLQAASAYPLTGIGATSGLFALAHLVARPKEIGPRRLADLFLFSVILGATFHFSGNLYCVMLIHLLRNMALYHLRAAPPAPGQPREYQSLANLGLGLLRLAGTMPAETFYRALIVAGRTGHAAGGLVAGGALRKRRETVLANASSVLKWKNDKQPLKFYEQYLSHGIRKLAEDTLLLASRIPTYRRFLLRNTRIEGLACLGNALAQDRGALIVTCHLGSLANLLPILLALEESLLKGKELLATNIRPAMLENFLRQRVAEASQATSARVGEVPVNLRRLSARTLLSSLRRGGVVITSADGDLYSRGTRRRATNLEVPLLGTRIRVGAGTAWLALRAGVPVLPAVVLRGARPRLRLVFDEPIEPGELGEGESAIQDLTGRIFERLERHIVHHPEQWLFWDRLHRLRTPSGS